jgi:acyl-CoA thioesterase-1
MNGLKNRPGCRLRENAIQRLCHSGPLAAGKAIFLVASFVLGMMSLAHAAPVRIVAIGASNTHGWYIGKQAAYPAQLQALLKARGIDAQVTNAGVPFETTAMMRQRLDAEVPDGTNLVILQPGANDLRFFGSREKRAENIAEMSERLRARSIPVIVYDEDIPIRYYTFDFIHLTREGHAMIATKLLPLVIAKLGLRQIPPRP